MRIVSACLLAAANACFLEEHPDFAQAGTGSETVGLTETSSASSTAGATTRADPGPSEEGTSYESGTGLTTTGTSAGEAGMTAGDGASVGETTFPCAKASIGSAVGVSVASGTTNADSDSWSPSCSSSETADAIYEWTAPSSGAFEFDTNGSYFDTTAVLLASCDGPELDCSDDFGGALWSQVRADLQAGEKVLIVIDGWTGGESGTYQLNIHGPL